MGISRSNEHAARITFRSVASGLIGGTFLCVAAPFNDWAMNNTFLIGNNMPLGAIMLLFAFVVLINGPLNRWRPEWSFSGFEISISFMLMLVMCALPTSGLIRYLLPNLVMPFQFALDSQAYHDIIARLGVAKWVFPDFDGAKPVNWIGDRLATGYNARWLDPDTSPYGRWITPFISWGIFCGALFWTLICLVCILLRQWRDNEHLPFPLAAIQLSIIEQPARGRWFNDLLNKRSFWITFTTVFLLHLNNGLHEYFPTHVEQISRGFDLQPILADKPWSFTDVGFRKCVVYFSVIGITYFLNSSVAFSLWFFFVLQQLFKMYQGLNGMDTGIPGLADQTQGASIAYFFLLVWLGRKHWRLVIAQALRGERPGEAVGTYISYRAAFWGIVGSIAVMVAWLVLAGATLMGACVIVTMLLIAFILITRIVAETGLIHGGLRLNVVRPFQFLATYTGKHVPLDTFYLGAVVQATHYDYREVVPVYLSHGMQNVDQSKPDRLPLARERQIGRRLIGLVCVALLIGYSTSFFSALWTHYNYAVSMDAVAMSPIDTWGQADNVRYHVLDRTVSYERVEETTFSPAGHFAFGFGLMLVISYLRFAFAWWPLHPIGYMLLDTFPISTYWFSIFLGWLLKIVMLRFGSASFYRAARPACIGLLLGESAAAGFWLLSSVILNARGLPFRAYLVLPQ